LSRFMAVHTLPFTEADLKKQMENAPKIPAGFKWNKTYCGFADHKFFCDWEAPSKEALTQTFKGMNMPFDTIYEVRLFDVAKKKLEL
jgi:hypothetical protein